MTYITSWNFIYGAGEGNRTLISSLGSSHSTDELRPHDVNIVSYINLFIQVKVNYTIYTYSGNCIALLPKWMYKIMRKGAYVCQKFIKFINGYL